MAFDITPLGIDEVLTQAREHKVLYVTNNSGTRYDPFKENSDGTTGGTVKQTLGLVHINYRNAAGDLTALGVPPTWAPINLAAYTALEPLITSDNFLSLLRKQVLVAMSKSDAERILNTPEARAELAEHSKNAGVVSSSVNIPLSTFRVGPQSVDPVDVVTNMPVNHEALAKLLDDFNNERITDAIATNQFERLTVSLEDITANMSAMQATDSQLFRAMINRIEALEAKQPAKTFQ